MKPFSIQYLHTITGIITEIVYALAIITVAFLVCFAAALLL